MIPIERKIGEPLRAAILFDEGEAMPVDGDGTVIICAIKQGDLRIMGAVEYQPDNRAVAMTVPTNALQPGRAIFDAWINNAAIPGGRNIILKMIEGAAR